MKLSPIQIAALNFVAERRADLRKINEPMRQRIIDLAMHEPPLVDVDADQVFVTIDGQKALRELTCARCKGSGRMEYTITYHGERNETVMDKCHYCEGSGLTALSSGGSEVMADEIENAKREFLLDALRRATANGSHKEVAAVIALDWFPNVLVEPNGDIKILVGGRERKSLNIHQPIGE